MQDPSARYSAVAITLHWLIAGLVIGNIVLGVWMHEAIDTVASRGLAVGAYQLHKSLGLSILALLALRLVWRLRHRPPPLPEAISRRQKRLAIGVHRCFYLLMLLVPLTGWLFVSTQWRGRSRKHAARYVSTHGQIKFRWSRWGDVRRTPPRRYGLPRRYDRPLNASN